MTTRYLVARRLRSALLASALTTCVFACGDEKEETPAAATGSSGAGTGSGAAGAKAGSGSTDPNAAATCPTKVYSALSSSCSSCACGADPQLAPSCQKPCWDFLACSFKAQAGKCASFAAGGMAMRPQFEACTMEECGAELAVPGAEVVSSYRSIIGACAVPMGETKAACGDDVAKFISQLK
jgi:hypothetical protein